MPEDADLKQPLVSIVIPTYRRRERCRRLVQALTSQTFERSHFEVIVVNNCSDDGTLEMVQSLVGELPYELRVESTVTNIGPARARNVGWKAARGEIVAFIDDDCAPQPDWLASGVKAFADRDVIGVVQGCTVPPPDFDKVELPRWHHKQNITSATLFFEACNIFYRREALLATSGFDEQIRWWGEDTALGWAVLAAGWEGAFAADAVVIHDVELRGWRWHLRAGLWERNTVLLAKMYPEFRTHFWRPWAFRRRDASLALALACALIGWRWRPALLGTAPYLWFTRQTPSSPSVLVHWGENLAVDASRLAGHAAGSWHSRTLVL